MLKDKVSYALPPEDVIIRKSNLVETLTAPENDRFLHRYRWPLMIISSVLIVLFVVAVGMAVLSLPIHAAVVDIDMYAVRMYENGRLSTEGRVIIRGDRLDYRDESIASEFDAAEITILDETYMSDNAVFNKDDGTIHGLYHSISGIYSITIELSPDDDWCVIRMNDRGNVQFIVCSGNEDFEPMEIFKKSTFAQN